MRFLHHCFVAVALFAVCWIAASLLTHTNPLIGFVVAALAGSSAVLIDYLDANHDRRIRAERDRVWERRDRES